MWDLVYTYLLLQIIRNSVARDDFDTNARSNKFIVTTTQLDLMQRVEIQHKGTFLRAAAQDNFSSLRDGLLSENFQEFFTRTNKLSQENTVSDDHTRYFFKILCFFHQILCCKQNISVLGP